MKKYLTCLLASTSILSASEFTGTSEYPADVLTSSATVTKAHANVLPFAEQIKNRLECAKAEDRPIIFVLGAAPIEAYEFNFSQFDNPCVFYSGGGANATFYSDEQLGIFDESEQARAQYGAGDFVRFNYNNAEQRNACVEIFRESLDLIIPDKQVCGYLKWNTEFVNDFLSMLKPDGQLIHDSHNNHGGITLNIFFEQSTRDAVEGRGACETFFDASQGKYVPILRTLEKLIAGEYYDKDAECFTRGGLARVGTTCFSQRLEGELMGLVWGSYEIYINEWFSNHIAIPCEIKTDRGNEYSSTLREGTDS